MKQMGGMACYESVSSEKHSETWRNKQQILCGWKQRQRCY